MDAPFLEKISCSRCKEDFPLYEKLDGSLRCKRCRSEANAAYRSKNCGCAQPDRKWKRWNFKKPIS